MDIKEQAPFLPRSYVFLALKAGRELGIAVGMDRGVGRLFGPVELRDLPIAGRSLEEHDRAALVDTAAAHSVNKRPLTYASSNYWSRRLQGHFTQTFFFSIPHISLSFLLCFLSQPPLARELFQTPGVRL